MFNVTCLRTHLFTLTVLVAVVLITAPSAPALAEAAERLGHHVVPVSQSIHLTLDPNEADYSGSVAIELLVKNATDRFRLHAEGMEISALTLSHGEADIEVDHAPEGEEIVAVTAMESLSEGRYTLRINFTNAFDTQAVSLYRMEHGEEGYAFTQFQASDARGAFPCWDEPEFKIPFQMTVTVPTSDTAVSNTPLASQTVDNEWKTLAFATTKPLPSYLLALAVGPLESVPMRNLGVPGAIVTVAGQSHLADLAVEMTPPILKALEDYFGSSYPYEKLDFIAIPEYWPGAMEHPGAVTYADSILLIESSQASTDQRRRLARIIAHELAHMWFGNLVTMAWWDDLWLNETFADWMGEKIADQVHPEFGLAVSQVQDAADIMERDARPTADAIRREVLDPNESMSSVGVAYNKGKAVLGMFEEWIGDDAFRRGVHYYLEANAWSNAESADLWKALDQASGKSLSAAMATFVDQPGFPLIDVEVGENNVVRLRQARFRTYGTTTEDLSWRVPVSFKYKTSDGIRSRTVLLDGKAADLVLETSETGGIEWILPNAGASGYYTWSLSPDMLASLVGAAGELSAREKIGLLGNLDFLLLAGVMSGGDYLDALGSLASDSDPLVVRSVVGSLDEVRNAFVPDELRGLFAPYLQETLAPVLDRIGWERAEGEAETASLLRTRLYERLGVEAGYGPVLTRARKFAAQYLEDPASVDPSLVGAALEIAALDGDEALFETYKKRFESATLPTDRNRFLAALGAFQAPELRAAARRYVFEGPVRPNEIFSILGGGPATAAARDDIYEWFTENYDLFAERLPPQFMAFMPFFASGCSAERLHAAREFFGRPEHQAPGLDEQLARVAAQVEECVALRKREGQAVTEYLRQRVESEAESARRSG
ncbi:MAG: M1 family metallopeptidase [Acidobacteriota bacterium]|nr:M1 family metallopeptidase [Acidobacteriota bacterium]